MHSAGNVFLSSYVKLPIPLPKTMKNVMFSDEFSYIDTTDRKHRTEMGDLMENKFDLYQDIEKRTNGEIYLGIVGPVRTGKSTFIKQFMDILVIPNMENSKEKERTIDELPQSAQGRTIMTTEPKFVPKEAAEIALEDQVKVKVRLVDCVGYLVPEANGHLEEGKERMVKTPWFVEEIPFTKAAELGTEKVIKEHSTIGIVITTDGSFGEITKENFKPAEGKTISDLEKIGKPYVIILNTMKPYSQETREYVTWMEEQYHHPVLAMNCLQLRKEDILTILSSALEEFPVAQMEFYIPKWTEILENEQPVKAEMINQAQKFLHKVEKMKDIEQLEQEQPTDIFRSIHLDKIDYATGTVEIRMELKEDLYYQNISEMTGLPIQGEYQLIHVLQEFSKSKGSYEEVKDAVFMVEQKGYSVIPPQLDKIQIEEPELIKHGNQYGVRLKAQSPSIHMIKANITTEIAPIVGTKEQAEELITFLKNSKDTREGVFETNIFGKSLGSLMEDGIHNKIAMMDDECQMKLQDTMQKIVNDNTGGIVCIII